MKKIIAFAFLVLTINACKQHPAKTSTQACTANFGFADTSAKHPKNSLYTKLIDDLVAGGVPGVSLMIEDSSGLWYKSAGMADIEAGTNFSACHNIKIASITKLFTAVLAYKLIDEGKLNLNDPVSKYIDTDIIKKLKNSEKSSIADLMQHSSGINDFVFDPEYILYVFNNVAKEKDYEKLLSFSYNKEPAFEYGTKRSYNYTVNYILLAMCINKIIGKDHALAQKEKIWTPLGMNQTYFRPVEDIPWSNTAKGYFDYRKKGVLQEMTQLFTGDGSGFTGVYSNTNDMRKFMNGVFRDNAVISAASLANLKNSNLPNDSVSYGIGSRMYSVYENNTNYKYFGHPGGEVMYASGAYYCPDTKTTITFVVNYGDAFEGQYSPAYLQFRKDVLKAGVKK
jgi:D-alanyl-D-alanine carboxypeptidase